MDIDKATAIFRTNYEKWAINEQRNKSGYDYEKIFVEMMETIGIEVLQASVGAIAKIRNSKKKSKPHSEK